jgi:hypothetical protein
MAAQSDLTKQQGAMTGAFDASGQGFDPIKFGEWSNKQAQAMGTVQGKQTLPGDVSSSLTGPVGSALKQDWDTQNQVLGQQAERNKQAFMLQSQGFSSGMQQTGEAKTKAAGRNQKVDEMQQQAMQQAQQYVTDAKMRSAEMNNKVESLHLETLKSLDAGKVHDMAVNLQGFLGQKKQTLKQVEQQYGRDSAEYAQTQQAYGSGIATAMSSVQSLYSKLRNDANMGYEQVAADVQKAGGQFVGYSEQNHVQILDSQAKVAASEAANRSNFDLAVAQLEGGMYENMANWLVASPFMSASLTPIMSYLAATEQANNAAASAERIAGMQGSGGGGGAGSFYKKPSFQVTGRA